MANQQLIQAALQAILDKEFNTWLLGIGSKGQELIKKLFLETAKKDQKLAAMAKEDPESTMILFAYQVYKLTKKSKDKSELESTEYETTEPEGEELEEMNYPPVSNPISAKFGAKLKHLAELNGHCPEGYEMRYFKKGGVVCGKCAKKKQLLMESMSCGGKKRIKKDETGGALEKVIRKNLKKYPGIDEDLAAGRKPIIKNGKKYYLNGDGNLIAAKLEGGLFKKGGKSLTKARANALKYQGGPGDINSTEGMKPNKKQKKMLCKRIGGMVNNAKKVTIYQLPGMVDYVKY